MDHEIRNIETRNPMKIGTNIKINKQCHCGSVITPKVYNRQVGVRRSSNGKSLIEELQKYMIVNERPGNGNGEGNEEGEVEMHDVPNRVSVLPSAPREDALVRHSINLLDPVSSKPIDAQLQRTSRVSTDTRRDSTTSGFNIDKGNIDNLSDGKYMVVNVNFPPPIGRILAIDRFLEDISSRPSTYSVDHLNPYLNYKDDSLLNNINSYAIVYDPMTKEYYKANTQIIYHFNNSRSDVMRKLSQVEDIALYEGPSMLTHSIFNIGEPGEYGSAPWVAQSLKYIMHKKKLPQRDIEIEL